MFRLIDSFTLQGVRLVLPDLKIRSGASMGFITDPDQYKRVQDGIRDLCAPKFFPVHYEIAAWDAAHSKSQKAHGKKGDS